MVGGRGGIIIVGIGVAIVVGVGGVLEVRVGRWDRRVHRESRFVVGSQIDCLRLLTAASEVVWSSMC